MADRCYSVIDILALLQACISVESIAINFLLPVFTATQPCGGHMNVAVMA